jgi:hypothetical protein
MNIHLIEKGDVQTIILSFLIPNTVIGKQNNYTRFCKHIKDIIRLQITCRTGNKFRQEILEYFFKELNVGYYATPVNGITYKVKSITHTINLIKCKMNNRFQQDRVEYYLYGKNLIAPPTFVY